jgi:hypothetical protein
MGMWTHSLKFNVGTGGIHQLPQTTEGGIHSLLEEVVWDVGDKLPNPVLQLFNCARFCPVHLLLCPAPEEKVTGREIWTSCRPFILVVIVVPANVPETSDPTRNVRSVQSVAVRHWAWTQVHRCFPSQIRGLWVNIPRTNATFSSDRDVDGRPLLSASLTEPVVRSFEWQFLIVVSWRIVAFPPFAVRHHLCTATTEFHTS